ncbi:hypothetical protein [Pseudobacteriovorax antillogorgiicola]|nr:hypothetical protein [Pseudobacteriovorax antillogorgiicola]TCS50796.1 hypothetical protein EDD56_112179 [Pseudobacteriovorax antillogorgiicola]
MTKNQENLTKSRDTHQVEDKPKRRQFSPEYKKKILTELEQTQGKRGAVGEILRREGLYATQVATWKSELEDGIAGLWSKKRGPKPNTEAALRKKIEKLEKRNAMLERRLGNAETIIDFQKKLASMVGIEIPEKDMPRSEDD